MSTRRNALGRGLGALIPTAVPPAAFERREPEPAPSGAPLEIPIARIAPNPQQPRRHFDDAELARLADSIGRHGVLQPVVVRERDGGYELVVGERRWRAARLAGRETLPAVVKDVASPDLLELALVENVQRHDLNPIELALAFRALADGGATQEEVGRARSASIARRSRTTCACSSCRASCRPTSRRARSRRATRRRCSR